MTKAKILIVGDAAYLEEPLRSLGYTVCATVPSAPRAIEEAAGTEPDLAVVDIGPEGAAGGLEAAERIGSRLGVPVVLLADGADEARADGDFLNIEVSDNGIGTAEKDTRALFAAGFTTKETGRGSVSIRPPIS